MAGGVAPSVIEENEAEPLSQLIGACCASQWRRGGWWMARMVDGCSMLGSGSAAKWRRACFDAIAMTGRAKGKTASLEVSLRHASAAQLWR